MTTQGTKAYVRALVSTGRLHYGEVAEMELTDAVQAKIDGGMLEVLPDQDLGGVPAEPSSKSSEKSDKSSTAAAFDPGEYNVDEVLDHLDDADDTERKRVLDAERKGKGRKGILDHGT